MSLLARLRSRPRWQLVAIAIVLFVVTWSILEALPTGNRPFSSGAAGSFALAEGHSTPEGTVHLEYQGERGRGVIIAGMDAGGTRGTVTVFVAVGRRDFGDIGRDCDGSWVEAAEGDLAGSLVCRLSSTMPGSDEAADLDLRFRAMR